MKPTFLYLCLLTVKQNLMYLTAYCAMCHTEDTCVDSVCVYSEQILEQFVTICHVCCLHTVYPHCQPTPNTPVYSVYPHCQPTQNTPVYNYGWWLSANPKYTCQHSVNVCQSTRHLCLHCVSVLTVILLTVQWQSTVQFVQHHDDDKSKHSL
jgi:hypothetical protein